MRITRNETLIKRRGRIGTYTTLVGMAVLFGGMIISLLFQQYLEVSLVALVVGFACSQIGSYYVRRWGRRPRPDEVLAEGLRSFDDRYRFYSWALAAPYALLTPQGIFAFSTRDQTGEISVAGARWRTKFNPRRLLTLFAQEGLSNPSLEASDSAQKLEKWIKASLPQLDVKVQPVVVFLNEKVKLDVSEPVVPVIVINGLKKWLRTGAKVQNLRTADYRAVEQLFETHAGPSGRT